MQIRKLKIYCKSPGKQREFYTQTLGFQCIHRDEKQFSLQPGCSELVFQQSDDFSPYHIAFRIPSNLAHEALAWLRERVPIIAHEGKELIDFKSWNAESMYFHDPEGNILEFIAHKSLHEDREAPFKPVHVIAIAEIGLATRKLAQVCDEIVQKTGIHQFTGNKQVFRPLGDKKGLLICINRNRKRWFPSDEAAFPSPFEAEIEAANGIFNLRFENDRIEIR